MTPETEENKQPTDPLQKLILLLLDLLRIILASYQKIVIVFGLGFLLILALLYFFFNVLFPQSP